jgi:hypothetical protein
MMALDALNNLDTFPLKNLDGFVKECLKHSVEEINVTGSNTDPLLYKHMFRLKQYLLQHIPNLRFGIRCNGVLALQRFDVWSLFDKGSISITTMNPELYIKTMGQGNVPDIAKIVDLSPFNSIKANVVLCPETVSGGDIFNTIEMLIDCGIKTINLREPYGQPHIGNPIRGAYCRVEDVFGMPCYVTRGTTITYWDVHYVEVESVNLYANGTVSTTYPITKGHDSVTGKVLGQEYFTQSGRVQKQWLLNSG